MTQNNTSRRALLKAASTATALVTVPSGVLAKPTAPDTPDDTFTREEHHAGCESARQIAMLHVARAWIDRWKALGGNFGFEYNRDSEPVGVMRGMTCVLETWKRTDRDRPDLPPHTWVIEDRHHDGAVKALEGMLELTPGLREAVREVAGRECFALWAKAGVA